MRRPGGSKGLKMEIILITEIAFNSGGIKASGYQYFYYLHKIFFFYSIEGIHHQQANNLLELIRQTITTRVGQIRHQKVGAEKAKH